MCRVDRFCCCCELRTGAIIVTVFTVISVVFWTAMIVISLTHDDVHQAELNRALSRAGYSSDGTRTGLWITRAIWISIAVTGCCVAVCLCCALSNNRAACVLPWLIWQMTAIVLLTIGAILFLIDKRWWDGVIQLAGIPLGIYIWVCMYSYYLELKGALHITRGV